MLSLQDFDRFSCRGTVFDYLPAAAAANLKPTATGSGGQVGRAAAGTAAAKQASANAFAATANLKLATAVAGGDASEDGRASCRALLYACC